MDVAAEQEWADQLTYYRDAIRSAYEAGDEMRMELAAKASRAVGTLVTAHAATRDARKLRAKLEELESWRASVTAAGTHGTRVDGVDAGQGGGAPVESVRREDSIH